MSWGKEGMRRVFVIHWGWGQTGKRDHLRFSTTEIERRLGVEVDQILRSNRRVVGLPSAFLLPCEEQPLGQHAVPARVHIRCGQARRKTSAGFVPALGSKLGHWVSGAERKRSAGSLHGFLGRQALYAKIWALCLLQAAPYNAKARVRTKHHSKTFLQIGNCAYSRMIIIIFACSL